MSPTRPFRFYDHPVDLASLLMSALMAAVVFLTFIGAISAASSAAQSSHPVIIQGETQ